MSNKSKAKPEKPSKKKTKRKAAEAPQVAPTQSPGEEGEVAAVWVKRDSLIPWADNPRDNQAAIPKVAASIQRFGFGNPILARLANREIIAGHTRWEAAGLISMDVVPVRFLDVSEEEAHLLAMADNKLGEKADWKLEDVARILDGYDLDDAFVAGWEQVEIDGLSAFLEDGITDNDPWNQWTGMPQFENPSDCHRKVIVSFENDEDVRSFFELLGQDFTEKTKSVWHPAKGKRDLKNKRWADDEGESTEDGAGAE